jgi:V/A-type H+-transporting ATPase subunit D
MISGHRPPATRSNVVRVRRRLEQVEKGAALLRKKRESLVAELFDRARPAVDQRRALERQASVAWRALLGALASNGRAQLQALGWPTREVRVDLAPLELWGMHVVDLAARPSLVRSLAARGTAPGLGDIAAVGAAVEFERLLEQLLEEAPKEHLMRLLGQALARATRLVNTLEQRVATSLTSDLAAMRRTLDEREREEHWRLKRIVARRRQQG